MQWHLALNNNGRKFLLLRYSIYINISNLHAMRGPKRSRTLLKLTIFSLPAELASALEEFIKMKARVFEIQHTGEQEVSGEVSL